MKISDTISLIYSELLRFDGQIASCTRSGNVISIKTTFALRHNNVLGNIYYLLTPDSCKHGVADDTNTELKSLYEMGYGLL